MSESQFFTRGKNRGNERKIVIKSAVLLVGKAPTLEKRIKLRIVAPLSNGKKSGIPEWIAAAHAFVAENHDRVTPKVELSGYDITFSDESLFEKNAVATLCKMRGFAVDEMGDAENPDVYLGFVIYTGYTDKLWRWGGQMAGKDIWAKFDLRTVEEEKEEQPGLTLVGDDEEEDEIEEEEDTEIDGDFDEVPAE